MPDPIGENRAPSEAAEPPLLAALAQIEMRGSLVGLVPDRTKRIGLMQAMSVNKLVTWNAMTRSYELTSFGHQCLAGTTSHAGAVARI
jgi:hypothetical protein